MAALLAIAELYCNHTRRLDHVSLKDAMIVGFAQVGALIPGVSRSGSTLTAALFLDLKREEAARFSFLLGLPAIAGAGISRLLRTGQSASRLARLGCSRARPHRGVGFGLCRHMESHADSGAFLRLAVRRLPRLHRSRDSGRLLYGFAGVADGCRRLLASRPINRAQLRRSLNFYF